MQIIEYENSEASSPTADPYSTAKKNSFSISQNAHALSQCHDH
jgi:surface antigen